MARYIDADKLDDEYYDLCYHGTIAVRSVLSVFVSLLQKQPTADVVEVVRCRDCKHYICGKCDKIFYIMDGYYQGGFEVKQPTDYCSYGERKE